MPAVKGSTPWNKGTSLTGHLSINRREGYNRAYYARNRDHLLKKAKAWQAANPEKVIATRKEYREKAKVVIRAIKEGNPCADCKQYFPACAMDFDHTGEDKTKEVSAYARAGNIKMALEEIKKM